MTNCTFSIIHIRIVLNHLSMSEAEDQRSWNTSECYFITPSWSHQAKLPQWTILTSSLPLLWPYWYNALSRNRGLQFSSGLALFVPRRCHICELHYYNHLNKKLSSTFTVATRYVTQQQNTEILQYGPASSFEMIVQNLIQLRTGVKHRFIRVDNGLYLARPCSNLHSHSNKWICFAVVQFERCIKGKSANYGWAA